jgi:hypothetical protein
MSRRQGRGRSAIITVTVVGAVIVTALLAWIGFSIFTGPSDDVLQCYTPRDDRWFTPVCP